MFIGHYSASLVAKRLVPAAPLWLLLLAAQLVDVFWALFILSGVERGRIIAGFTRSNPLDLYYMPYTHSLPAALLWSLGAGVLAMLWFKRSMAASQAGKVAMAVGCVVASHWALDWLVHKPDLPLWGNQFKVGLGLWDYRLPTLVLEWGLLIGAAWWLSRDTATWQRAGGKSLGIFVAVMLLIHLGNLFGPLPPSMAMVGASGLFAFLLLAAIAAWLERNGKKHV